MKFKKDVQEWIVTVVILYRCNMSVSTSSFKTMNSAVEYATSEIVTTGENAIDGDSELSRAEISERLWNASFFRGCNCDFYIETSTLSK